MDNYLNDDSRDIYLMDILDAGFMPNAAEWEIIYQCVTDNEVGVRADVAEILGIRCNEKDEELLRQLSYDKQDELVRVCALTSLQMGREEKTSKCLYELMRTGCRMTRGYAVCAFFDVWVNRNGYTKDSIRKCWRKIEKLYKKEKNLWVLSAYEGVRYHCGCKSGLLGLKNILCEAQGYEDVQGITLGQLMYLRNIYNEQEINQIVEESKKYMGDFPGLQKRAEKFLEEKEIPMALFLDRENAGLSQMLFYLSGRMDKELWIESAGLKPAGMTRAGVREQLGRSDDIIERYYYPRKVRRIYNYEYIVPLGIRLNPEKYPFHKIIPIFEGVDENILDVAQAEKMLDELKAYIDNDLRGGCGRE